MGHLRKCTLKDLDYVSKNMRDMDKLEAVYQTDQDAETALKVSYLASKEAMAICGDEDNPIGVCGVTSNGCIYMVSTDELFSSKKYRIQLIRKGRIWVDELMKSYTILYNVVYAENEVAMKWLKSLGFKFIEYHEEYGKHKKPFYQFMRIA